MPTKSNTSVALYFLSNLEIDSFMFQSVAAEAIKFLAQSMNLPLHQSVIKGSADCSSKAYFTSPSDEVRNPF